MPDTWSAVVIPTLFVPRSKGVSTPVLILSALHDEDHRIEGLNAGANDYLTKPFHIDQLKLRIDLLLEKYSR
jgi:DNA-binding response OmpR family regulator